MISKLCVLLAMMALAALICGCISQNDGSTSKQINVVATITPLGEFAKAVGGDRVKVTVMVPPGGEPHTFEPMPSQMKEVADADVYVENGLGLESWIDRIIKVNRRMLLIDSSTGVELIDGSANVDPHIWLSLRNAKIQARNICDGLIQVDPSGRDIYIRNRDDYQRKLEDIDNYLNSTFARYQEKKFIVLHPAWSYFARDYGLEEIAINLEEKEPGPKYLGEIIDLARANNITTIFVEPQFNPALAEVIVKEIKGRLVALDPLAEDYTNNMRHAGDLIAESLRD